MSIPVRALGALLLVVTVLFSVAARAESSPAATSEQAAPSQATLWYFWREGCPHCEEARVWLADLEKAHPELEVRSVEVVRDPAGRELFLRMMAERGQQASGVPTFIVNDEVWVGFSPMLAQDVQAAVRALGMGEDRAAEARRRLDLGPLGVVDLDGHSLFLATVLIAFVDGFNPCSLWVLTVLLAMVLGTRSRARIAAIGLTFLAVTAGIYGVFITGLFTALVVAGHLGWIQVTVALLALGFGAVNVKDFFAYKQGLSFTIPDSLKPRIVRGGRALRGDRPLPVVLGLTVAFAGGVALVELPCTAGFPVVWTTLVSEAGTSPAGFAGLLSVYLLVYLLDEVAVLLVALVTLKATRMQERHGRQLKLVSGMVMIALAGVLLVDPRIMEKLTGSLLVITAAVAASGLVLLGDRLWRARRGPA
jgi:cytochrome c biogenesis protein CcdA/glutaredoxin